MLNLRILFAISIVLLICAFFNEGKYKISYILSPYIAIYAFSFQQKW